VSQRNANILRGAAAWTIFVWVVFVWNILGDDTRSTGFKFVHLIIAIVSVGFGLAILNVVSRERRHHKT
jgi:hypothetical protein